MGVPGKPQVDGGEVLESDAKKWVIAGISLRAPLKSIYTNPVDHHKDTETTITDKEEDQESCSTSTTPTGREAGIPTSLTCPPPPMKRKPSLKFNFGSAREFFTPPDLDTFFIRHV